MICFRFDSSEKVVFYDLCFSYGSLVFSAPPFPSFPPPPPSIPTDSSLFCFSCSSSYSISFSSSSSSSFSSLVLLSTPLSATSSYPSIAPVFLLLLPPFTPLLSLSFSSHPSLLHPLLPPPSYPLPSSLPVPLSQFYETLRINFKSNAFTTPGLSPSYAPC